MNDTSTEEYLRRVAATYAAKRRTPDVWARQFHTQHSDNPTDADPVRSGGTCGPACDLYEPADEARAKA